MVDARMLARLCATCARARWCCDCGGWPPYCFFSVCSSFGSDTLLVVQLLSPSFVVLSPMAPKVRGERRAAERADREAAETTGQAEA